MRSDSALQLAHVLIFALLFGGIACGRTNPEDTVLTFLQEVEQGELNDAYEKLATATKAEASEAKVKRALQIMQNDLSVSGGASETWVVDSSSDGSTATVHYKIRNEKDVLIADRTVTLIREEGAWKLALWTSLD